MGCSHTIIPASEVAPVCVSRQPNRVSGFGGSGVSEVGSRPAMSPVDALAHRSELAPQRIEHDWLDDHQDLLVVGVVRAELVRACRGRSRARTACRGSPAPRATSRVAPRRAWRAAPRRVHGITSAPSNSLAVEPLDALVAEEAAGLAVRHAQEEVGEPCVRTDLGVGATRRDHVGQDALTGSSRASSANRQKTTRLRWWATASGSWPRSCMERAISAKLFAAALVISSTGFAPAAAPRGRA